MKRTGPFVRTLRSLKDNTRAGVALAFGLAAPVMFALSGVVVDYSRWSSQLRKLQVAADAAAVAGAKELALTFSEQRIDAVAEAVVRAQIQPAAGQSEVEVVATIERDQTAVRVVLRQQAEAIMSKIVTPALTHMAVSATAVRSGSRRLCLLGLDTASERTVSVQANSAVTAQKCDVHSNSTSPSGIANSANTTITTALACSAGGFLGGGRVSGQKLTDCPAFNDPLRHRQPPPVGLCKINNNPIIDLGLPLVPYVLTPGTYCGGLHIGGASVVIFTPGIYVIKDGPLLIDSLAVVKGINTGFYFTGTVAEPFVFKASPNSVVDLSAPRDGPMAGLLFFEDRAASALRPFEILSNTARTLLGTLYMPNGRFVVNSNAILADRSAYTVIIARRVELDGNPTLVLNANYNETDVPVPPGVRSSDESVRLVH